MAIFKEGQRFVKGVETKERRWILSGDHNPPCCGPAPKRRHCYEEENPKGNGE